MGVGEGGSAGGEDLHVGDAAALVFEEFGEGGFGGFADGFEGFGEWELDVAGG